MQYIRKGFEKDASRKVASCSCELQVASCELQKIFYSKISNVLELLRCRAWADVEPFNK